MSRDPLTNAELSQGPNLYSYVKNNPVNLTDPQGECPEWFDNYKLWLKLFFENGGSIDWAMAGGDIFGGGVIISLDKEGVLISPFVGVGNNFGSSITTNMNSGSQEGFQYITTTVTGGNGQVGGQITIGKSENGTYGSAGVGVGVGAGWAVGMGYGFRVWRR